MRVRCKLLHSQLALPFGQAYFTSFSLFVALQTQIEITLVMIRTRITAENHRGWGSMHVWFEGKVVLCVCLCKKNGDLYCYRSFYNQ